MAFAKGSDRGFLKNCRIIGRQDALFGDNDVRVAIEKGILNGACDYIFGGINSENYQVIEVSIPNFPIFYEQKNVEEYLEFWNLNNK